MHTHNLSQKTHIVPLKQLFTCLTQDDHLETESLNALYQAIQKTLGPVVDLDVSEVLTEFYFSQLPEQQLLLTIAIKCSPKTDVSLIKKVTGQVMYSQDVKKLVISQSLSKAKEPSLQHLVS